MSKRRRSLSPKSLDDTVGGAEPEVIEKRARITGPISLVQELSAIAKANPVGLNDEYQYVPEEELYGLLHLDTIKRALGENVALDLAQYILDKARKTFATLCLVFELSDDYRTHAMLAFMKAEFTDEELSSETFVECQDDCEAVKPTCRHFFPSPEPWNLNRLYTFNERRWQFLVPNFDHKAFLHRFHHQQRLPWRSRFTEVVISSGNFSQVSCLKMIGRHQNLLKQRKDGTVVVAVKTLKVPDDVTDYDIVTEYFREAKAHDQLNERSAHLIRGIAAYELVNKDTKHNTYQIILEWADGGSLLSFWQKNRKPQLDNDVKQSRRNIRDLLKQFRGLAEALESMHFGTSLSRRSSIQNTETSVMETTHEPPRSPNGHTSLPTFRVTGVEAEVVIEESETESYSYGPNGGDRVATTKAVRRDSARRNSFTDYWRHGDIKPANILRFLDECQGTDSDSVHEQQDNMDLDSVDDQEQAAQLGFLKLADLGRAQQHLDRTARRSTRETERFRTRWYEPPDLNPDLEHLSHGKISRLFDIWSMGCVFLDGLLWMFYGMDAIEDFQSKAQTSSESFVATPYWIKTGDGSYRVTDAALALMDHLSKACQEYSPALTDLVQLVKEKLLVVELLLTQKNTPKAVGHKDDTYVFRVARNFDARLPLANASQLTSTLPIISGGAGKLGNSLNVPHSSSTPGLATRAAKSKDYTNTMTNAWKWLNDEAFAGSMIRPDQIPDDDDDLCLSCREVNLLSKELVFHKSDNEANVDNCPLCTLVTKSVAKAGIAWRNPLRLTRELDQFVLRQPGTTSVKILRLCRTKNSSESRLQEIPLGAPNLYKPDAQPDASGSFMRLPNTWLENCNQAHIDTCAPQDNQTQLPKRLIDVSKIDKPKIVDSATLTNSAENRRYLAFSHKWGVMPANATTTVHNLPARRRGIPEEEIPKSFANAIAITKALGCRYLWIDSLCINQRCHDNDGDFKEQAGSMQSVYANAYCVIAASSAEGATEGFLQRDTRACSGSVKKGDIYISAVTNDFDRDVLNSPLARRSWVLQERALARRTIFFTNRQMYWECGQGVRCETLRRMNNDRVAFLGDAHFPDKATQVDTTRGSQIDLWESLFKDYSGLEISTATDRSIAIEGLITRLSLKFKSPNLFGLFYSFWGRCLLWRRPQGAAPMTRVLQKRALNKLAPTWSWMAVHERIDFLDPEGNKVDWNADVKLPNPPKGATSPQLQQPERLPLRPADSITEGEAFLGRAFDLNSVGAPADKGAYFFDDDTRRADGQVKAVIICTSHDKMQHHVLLVSEAAPTTSPPTCERIGIAILPESCIVRTSGVQVAIG
ncbi:unnamed protein product [Alternaria alternata]